MSFKSWLSSVTQPRRRPIRGARKAPLRTRLAVEALEDRLAPATFAVTLTSDTGLTNSLVTPLGPGTAGDLRNAIFQADQASGQNNVIDLRGVSGTIALEAMLPPIFTTGTGSLTIEGPGAGNLTISGQGAVRPFFILQGNVSVSDLTIANGLAQGGAGGEGAGGGAGLGGGMLIDGTTGATTVTLTNVAFAGNQAVGGAGGVWGNGPRMGGGGGAGGNGGVGNGGAAGGGGGGFLGNGGSGSSGGGGGFTGAGGADGSNGTDIGGGGGGGPTVGSTGGGAGVQQQGFRDAGGGGGIDVSGFPVHSPGTDAQAAGVVFANNLGGNGGFGAGGVGYGGGGGGAGLGGALFQRGGTLDLIGTTFTNNTATGGAARNEAPGGPGFPSGDATAGKGSGGALFIYDASFGGTATANAPSGAPTFSGNSAEMNADVAGTLSGPTVSPTVTTVTDAGGTYNGTAYAATVTVTGSGTITGSPTVDYFNNTTGTDLGSTAPINAGHYTVTATYPGDATHTGSSGTATFDILKAALTVTANNQTIIIGEALPAFTVSYSGFVNNETSSVLGGTLAFSTTYTAGSPPGTYSITPSGLASSNYAITFVSGTLTVLSLSQATTNLLNLVNSSNLPSGTQNSLDAKLNAAIAAFDRGDTTAGDNQLRAFINEVNAQSGKTIDPALATIFVADAQRIINA
jgi:hypothetical protein